MDPDRLTLSVVVPAYNEESRLGYDARRAQQYLSTTPWDWEIRVVDDGSSDRTCAVVEDYAVRFPCIALQREPHRGKGGAVKAGVLASAERLSVHLRRGPVDAGRRAARDSCRRC